MSSVFYNKTLIFYCNVVINTQKFRILLLAEKADVQGE